MQYSKMNREELEDLKSELKKQYDDVTDDRHVQKQWNRL